MFKILQKTVTTGVATVAYPHVPALRLITAATNLKSPKNTLIAILALVAAATAALAWHQYRELIDIRAQLAEADNVKLRNQLADARKTIRSLEDRIAALRGRRGGPDRDLAGDGAGGGHGRIELPPHL